jgi:hypothetical protein
MTILKNLIEMGGGFFVGHFTVRSVSQIVG